MERLAFHLGADFSLLFKARHYVAADTFKVLKNYRSLDFSARIGLVYKVSHRINVYSSFVYGLSALVVTPLLDDYGSYIKEVRDIRNISLQLGLQLTLLPRPRNNDEKY